MIQDLFLLLCFFIVSNVWADCSRNTNKGSSLMNQVDVTFLKFLVKCFVLKYNKSENVMRLETRYVFTHVIDCWNAWRCKDFMSPFST